MMQSGLVDAIWADVAYKGDHFVVYKGTDPRIEHEPSIEGDESEILAAYACARVNGAVIFQVLGRNQIEKIRAASKSKDGPAWSQWPEEMAKKSAIKRLTKLLPKDRRAAAVLAYDNAVEAGDKRGVAIALDRDDEIIEVDPEPPKNGTSKLKESVRGVVEAPAGDPPDYDDRGAAS